MGTSTEKRTLPAAALWTGRIVACFFLILGSLVFVSFAETGSLWLLVFAIMGVGGALLSIVGLERPGDPRSRWAHLAGWLMMAAFSLIPTSLLFLPLVLALSALPALFLRFQRSWYASGRSPSVDEHER